MRFRSLWMMQRGRSGRSVANQGQNILHHSPDKRRWRSLAALFSIHPGSPNGFGPLPATFSPLEGPIQPEQAYTLSMRKASLLRRIACVALASFAFAQGVAASMGCGALRAQDNVAVMPSGEPCEMLGAVPAPMTLKVFAPDASTGHVDGGADHLVAHPAASFLTVALPHAGEPDHRAAPRLASPRNLGPPPYLATLRLRV